MNATKRWHAAVCAAALTIALCLCSGSALAGDGQAMSLNTTRGEDIIKEKPALADPWSMKRFGAIFRGGPQGPTWPDAEMFIFTAEIDEALSAVWLPPPLKPTQPAKATVFIAKYPTTRLGFGYNEAAVFLHGTHEGREYMHCTWMVVDDDTALILGRELLGFPKKIAVIEADIHADSPQASVVRKGLPVIDIQTSNLTPIESGQLFSHPVVNVMGTIGQPVTLAQASPEETFHSGRAADFEVTFGQSELDPLYKLGIAAKQKGIIVIIDMGSGARGNTEEPSLSGTPVEATWMMQAFHFRVY